VDVPATLIFGKGWEKMRAIAYSGFEIRAFVGKFSISDTAHSAAHWLFRQRQQYQWSSFIVNLLPAACRLPPARTSMELWKWNRH
jgi:hypothetical protein